MNRPDKPNSVRLPVIGAEDASGGAPQSREELLAQGVAERMVGVLRALDRQDQLEDSREFAGWLEGFTRDPEGMKDAARELTLRAFRVSSDRANFRILRLAAGAESRLVTGFCEALGMGRVEIVERIHDMAQVGVLAQDMVSGAVRATPLGIALAGMVDEAAGRAADELAGRLSELFK